MYLFLYTNVCVAQEGSSLLHKNCFDKISSWIGVDSEGILCVIWKDAKPSVQTVHRRLFMCKSSHSTYHCNKHGNFPSVIRTFVVCVQTEGLGCWHGVRSRPILK